MTQHEAKVREQFTRWAAPFAALPAHAEGEALARSLSAAGLESWMRVLDVACGPGIVACAAAGMVAQVVGVDLTPAMIEQARHRQQAQGLANCDWHVGNATALPFGDAGFDAVLTRYSFHHMPDPAAALAQMVRVCRPGGRVTVIDATPDARTQGPYDAMERLRDPSHASALTLAQLRDLGRAAGLKEQACDGYRLEVLLDTLADAADMAALTSLFEADIASGEDRIGVQAWRAADGIRFFFPVSILSWRKPD